MGEVNDNETAESQMAKTLQDLTKGERTATALEDHLTQVEKQIDALLGMVEKSEGASSNGTDQKSPEQQQQQQEKETPEKR